MSNKAVIDILVKSGSEGDESFLIIYPSHSPIDGTQDDARRHIMEIKNYIKQGKLTCDFALGQDCPLPGGKFPIVDATEKNANLIKITCGNDKINVTVNSGASLSSKIKNILIKD